MYGKHLPNVHKPKKLCILSYPGAVKWSYRTLHIDLEKYCSDLYLQCRPEYMKLPTP